MKSKYWIPFVLLFIVLILVVAPGCNRTVTPTTTQYPSSLVPTITSAPSVPAITAADAYTLIQKNGSNPNFVILSSIGNPDKAIVKNKTTWKDHA